MTEQEKVGSKKNAGGDLRWKGRCSVFMDVTDIQSRLVRGLANVKGVILNDVNSSRNGLGSIGTTFYFGLPKAEKAGVSPF